jgi:hypothetical protein
MQAAKAKRSNIAHLYNIEAQDLTSLRQRCVGRDAVQFAGVEIALLEMAPNMSRPAVLEPLTL